MRVVKIWSDSGCIFGGRTNKFAYGLGRSMREKEESWMTPELLT